MTFLKEDSGGLLTNRQKLVLVGAFVEICMMGRNFGGDVT
jgi:hypothetical protein